MPEIPVDLTPRKRDDGKLDLIGKDATGADYVARTCEHGAFTAADAEALAAGDRERVTPGELVRNVVAEQTASREAAANAYEDSLGEPAERVVWGALHSFWGKGYGPGTALHRDGQFRKRRWIFDKDGIPREA